MTDRDVLSRIHNGLIVSCQAHRDWPMYGPEVMADFAKAAQLGGAVGIRASGVQDITAIQAAVHLPMIGIQKHWSDDYTAFITPCWQDALAILQTGVEIIALDAGPRTHPNGETFASIAKLIRLHFPHALIMAEIASIQEAEQISQLDFDLLSTTLSGYTSETAKHQKVDLDLIHTLSQHDRHPVVAEGHVSTPEEADAALQAGAWSVVVGTAITRPEVITQRFVKRISGKRS